MTPSLFEIEPPTFVHGQVSLDLVTASAELQSPPPSASLVESVSRLGIIYPIAVRRLADGYRVIDGARRVLAARSLAGKLSPEQCQALGLDPLAAVIFPEDTADSEALTLVLNYQRSDNIARDFLALETLLRRGLTEQSIANTLGMDLVTIRQRVKLLGLLPDLREAFLACQIKPGIAERIAKLSPARQKQLAFILLNTGKVTGKDLDTLAAARASKAVASLPLEALQTPGHEPAQAPPVPPPVDSTSGQSTHRVSYLQELLAIAQELRTLKRAQCTATQLAALAERLEQVAYVSHPQRG